MFRKQAADPIGAGEGPRQARPDIKIPTRRIFRLVAAWLDGLDGLDGWMAKQTEGLPVASLHAMPLRMPAKPALHTG